MNKSLEKNTGKNNDNKAGKNVHTAPGHPDSHHNNKRPRLAGETGKKRTVTATATTHSSPSSSRRVEDIRLVLKSTGSDDELEKKVGDVDNELQAVVQALADEGTYLGIVDKAELEKRKQLLHKRRTLLKEERDLLNTLRIQLAEEERAAAERIEVAVTSSPSAKRSSSSSSANNHNNTVTARQPSSPLIRRSSSSASASASTPPSASKIGSMYQQLSPKGVGGDIGAFIKRNSAAVGKKLAGAGGFSSGMSTIGKKPRGGL